MASDTAADNKGGAAQQHQRARLVAFLANMIQHPVSHHVDENEANTASSGSDEDDGQDERGGTAEVAEWGYDSDDHNYLSDYFDAQELAEIQEHMTSLSVDDNTQLAEIVGALVPQRE